MLTRVALLVPVELVLLLAVWFCILFSCLGFVWLFVVVCCFAVCFVLVYGVCVVN